MKVEVLGVLDRSTGNFRLRATEPRTGPDRFANIFAPLPIWVLKASKIVTDNSVDREKLKVMGYTNVVQTVKKNEFTNSRVMDYLKKVVPKMFQVKIIFIVLVLLC